MNQRVLEKCLDGIPGDSVKYEKSSLIFLLHRKHRKQGLGTLTTLEKLMCLIYNVQHLQIACDPVTPPNKVFFHMKPTFRVIASLRPAMVWSGIFYDFDAFILKLILFPKAVKRQFSNSFVYLSKNGIDTCLKKHDKWMGSIPRGRLPFLWTMGVIDSYFSTLYF